MVGDYSELTTALVALAAAGFAYIQLRRTNAISKSDFMLHLEELWGKHWETHINLRDRQFSGKRYGPASNEDWAKVEAYMGLFERLNRLLEEKAINLDDVVNFYGYRLWFIWRNDSIREEKLVWLYYGWIDFIELTRKIVDSAPKRFPELRGLLEETVRDAHIKQTDRPPEDRDVKPPFGFTDPPSGTSRAADVNSDNSPNSDLDS